MYWVYLLRCGDGSLYTGCTNDLVRRLRAHQSGRGAKYTRSRLPVELVYREPAADRSAALRREAAIKAMTRAEKLALLAAIPEGEARGGENEQTVKYGENVRAHYPFGEKRAIIYKLDFAISQFTHAPGAERRRP